MTVAKKIKRSYILENAEARRDRYPRFWLPALEDRCSLAVGDRVRLIFDGGGRRLERMWVLVSGSRSSPLGYLGTLAIDPISGDLRRGDAIEFRPEHVVQIARVGE